MRKTLQGCHADVSLNKVSLNCITEILNLLNFKTQGHINPGGHIPTLNSIQLVENHTDSYSQKLERGPLEETQAPLT
jgi:hypothetical protein